MALLIFFSLKNIVVNSILIVFIIQVILIWYLFIRNGNGTKFYLNIANKLIVKNANYDLNDFPTTINDLVRYEKDNLVANKETEKDSEFKLKLKRKFIAFSQIDEVFDELESQAPLELNITEEQEISNIEKDINDSLSGNNAPNVDEISPRKVDQYENYVPLDVFTNTTTFQINRAYNLVLDSYKQGYLELHMVETEEKLIKEVDYFMGEYLEKYPTNDIKLIYLIRDDLRKGLVAFLKRFKIINLVIEDVKKNTEKEKEKLREKNQKIFEETMNALAMEHKKFTSDNKKS